MFDLVEYGSTVKTALVTGSSGNIGSILVSKLLAEGWEVFGVTSRPINSNNQLFHQITFDWSSPKKFLIPNIDVVFHLASQNSAYEARNDVIRNVTNNLLSFVTIIESVRESGSKPVVIQTGSISEYGLEIPTLDEEFLPNPKTFYESSKLTNQIYGDQYAKEKIIKQNFILRLSNVYGNIQRVESAQRGFLDRSIRLGLSGEQLIFFGTGEYLRDYIHVNDVVQALLTCYNFSEKLKYTTYDIGTNKATTVLEMLQRVILEIREIANIKVSLVQKEFPTDSYEIEKRNGYVNRTNFGDETGWKPQIMLSEGIREAIFSILRES